MHIFLDNFHQGGKYSAQIASHQAELRKEETFTDQKYLSILSLQTDYINLDSRSGCGKNSERSNIVQKKCTFCGSDNHSAEKCFKRMRKEKGNSCPAGDSYNTRMERTPRECFRCGSEHHLIENFPEPPNDNEKR